MYYGFNASNLAIALTFYDHHFINNNENKGWLSNIVLLILLALSIIFLCLLDKKLDRQEVEMIGRLKEQNQNKKETDIIGVNNNGNNS